MSYEIYGAVEEGTNRTENINKKEGDKMNPGSNRLKIAYIGFDIFIDALYGFHKNNCDILKIFTCETDNFTEFNQKIISYSKEHSIPLQITRITQENLDELALLGCELIFCAGYYHKIPTDTSIPMINLHPSLLPDLRGSWPLPYLIMNHAKITGITLHKIIEKFDAGDMITQVTFSIDELENLETLTAKICQRIPSMIDDLCMNLTARYEQAIPQILKPYCNTYIEDDFPITPSMTSNEASLILRAFYGYECVYYKDEKRYGLIRSSIQADETPFPLMDGFIAPEQVVTYDNN